MGTHQSLLQAKGLYYNLYLLQYDDQMRWLLIKNSF
jgi:hypothetical protein